MKSAEVLIIGGGIGGLTAAIALRARGFAVDVIERDPTWSVYGVGIVQQANVVREMSRLGLIDDYLGAAFPFDHVEIFLPGTSGSVRIPSPKLSPGYPANVGIGRPALHRVLGGRAEADGAKIHLGLEVDRIDDVGTGVEVTFSDTSTRRYGLVIGADGINSSTRRMLFPDAPLPHFTGQGGWRYNLPRPMEVDCLRFYEGPVTVGLMPLSDSVMYMYLTTAEPGNPRYLREGIASAMRSKLGGAPPAIAALAEQITDDAGVVYRPFEAIFVEGDWHRGRVALLGDAVHATTPHLGQGAGMAIEDAIVLAEEIERADAPEEAFRAYHARRVDRCRYIYETSLMVCDAQLGRREPVNFPAVNREMFERTAEPI